MPHSKKPKFCLTLESDNEVRIQMDGSREELMLILLTAMDDELVLDVVTGVVLCMAHMEENDDNNTRQNLN